MESESAKPAPRCNTSSFASQLSGSPSRFVMRPSSSLITSGKKDDFKSRSSKGSQCQNEPAASGLYICRTSPRKDASSLLAKAMQSPTGQGGYLIGFTDLAHLR